MSFSLWSENLSSDTPLFSIVTAPMLTRALQSSGAKFSVIVRELGNTNNYPPFADLSLSENLFTRRVALRLDGQEVVHAQSVCAFDSPWKEILHCGNTSLGTILFSGSLKIKRTPLQFASSPDYWCARRSVFITDDFPLYLAECFTAQIKNFTFQAA